MADSPESISALARQVDRNYAEVHADLDVLADYRAVAFERDRQARQPYIPYDRIEYSGTITHQPSPPERPGSERVPCRCVHRLDPSLCIPVLNPPQRVPLSASLARIYPFRACNYLTRYSLSP